MRVCTEEDEGHFKQNQTQPSTIDTTELKIRTLTAKTMNKMDYDVFVNKISLQKY